MSKSESGERQWVGFFALPCLENGRGVGQLFPPLLLICITKMRFLQLATERRLLGVLSGTDWSMPSSGAVSELTSSTRVG